MGGALMDDNIYCPDCKKQITGHALMHGVSEILVIFCCNPECSRCGVLVYMDAVKDWKSHSVTALKYRDPEISPVRKVVSEVAKTS
jgi:hypothetical protein